MSVLDVVHRSAELVCLQRNVRQVYVIGSAGKDSADEHSDIDLLAVCSERPSASSRLRHYRRNLPALLHFHTFNLKSWEFGTSDSFIFDGRPLCIMYYTDAELDEKINKITQGGGQPLGFYYPTGFLSALGGARLIAGTGSEREQRRFSQFAEFPQGLLQRVRQRSRLQLKYFLDAASVGLRREDHFFAQQCLLHLREAVLSLTFATARRYRVSDKRMVRELKLCEAKVPEPLMALAMKLFTLSDFAPDTMRTTISQLAPLISSTEEALCR